MGRSEWKESLDTGLGCRTPNVLTGGGFGVSEQDPEAGAVPVLEPGQDPAWCHISGEQWPPGTLQGLSLGCGEGDTQVTPGQDQELPLLGTSGHICRANPSTSVLTEVQK